jgi:hypothetical protein
MFCPLSKREVSRLFFLSFDSLCLLKAFQMPVGIAALNLANVPGDIAGRAS